MLKRDFAGLQAWVSKGSEGCNSPGSEALGNLAMMGIRHL